MKKFVLFFILFHSVQGFAQNGFYLRTGIERKWHLNSSKPYSVTTAQGFKFDIIPDRFYTYRRFSFNLAASLGYKNNNFFFEAGWAQDDSNQGVTIIGPNYIPETKTYNTMVTIDRTGVSYSRIPFTIGYKIWGRDSILPKRVLRWDCFFYAGFDILIRPKIAPESGYSQSYLLDSLDHYMIYESTVGSDIRWGSLCSWGFMFKAYNKQGRSIINFNIQFSQGALQNQSSYTKIRFTNYDGMQYKSNVFSKASGIYIGLSKDIVSRRKSKLNKAWEEKQKK